MPAGRPGAAIVKSTTAGQAAKSSVQLTSIPKTWESTKGA